MGLDILLETRSETSRKSCHLSRQFCREMINQMENGDSIINQLIRKYEINKKIIDEINVWDLERKFHSTSTKLTKREIESRYQMAWKKVEDILKEIEKLKTNFMIDDTLFSVLKNADSYQKDYYKKVINIEEGMEMSKIFGVDLELMIDFLKKLSKSESVKFHYF